MNQIVAEQLAISQRLGSKSKRTCRQLGRYAADARRAGLCYISNIMASRSVNKVILVGHLGQDAETRFTPSGVPVTSFSVATSRRWKDQQTNEWKEDTNWSNVVLWRAENLAPYLTKGKQVYVEGRLQTRSYDDKDNKKVYRTEVVADDVILLSGGAGRADEESGGARGAGAAGSGGSSRGSAGYGASKGGAAKPAAAAGGEDPYSNMNVTDDDVPF
jgi:single-strand DNA-binding protein